MTATREAVFAAWDRMLEKYPTNVPRDSWAFKSWMRAHRAEVDRIVGR